MKKLLLTLILAIAFGGSMFAQEHYWDFTSHFETQNGLVAYVQIDGQIITYDDNFEAIEVAMFVNDEIRGTYFMYDGEMYYIYLRWRHQDPWTAEIVKCDKNENKCNTLCFFRNV